MSKAMVYCPWPCIATPSSTWTTIMVDVLLSGLLRICEKEERKKELILHLIMQEAPGARARGMYVA
jgi:hypothetical protein